MVLAMQYRDIIAELVKRRSERGWSRPTLAARLGTSKQVLGNWENIRNRATVEDLSRWAGELGCRIVFAIMPKDAPAVPDEMQAVMNRLSPEQQQWVLDFADTLPRLSDRDYGLLTGFVASMRDSLSDETS